MAEEAGLHTRTQESKQKCSNSCKRKPNSNSSISPADRVLKLQRTAGNQVVQRLIKSGTLQAKLRIGQPNDIYEQEADRVAKQVMRMSDPVLQRRCPNCDEDENKVLQAKNLSGQVPLTQGHDMPHTVHDLLQSSGQPLDPATRAFMEERFGQDFSRVRVHTGAVAEQSARDVNANAFTVGHDIVFGAGQFTPRAQGGQRLIAHELTHVVQQTGAGSGWATYPTATIQRDESGFNPIPDPDNLVMMYRMDMVMAKRFDRIADRLVIAVRFQTSPYTYVIRVLKAVGEKYEDNLSAAFVKRLSEPELDQFAASSSGRHMLNVLYEAIITGDVSEFERGQANRILMIKMRRLTPEDYLKSMKMTSSRLPTRIFPFRLMRVTPGYDYAPPNAKLLPNGKVWVNYPTRVLFMDTFKEELRTPIYQAFLSEGLQLNPNEIIGIKDYERGGRVNYLPALALIDYSNQAKQSTLGKIIEVSVFAATMGLGGGAVAGGRALAGEATAAARWGAHLARGAHALDRVANFIGIAHFVIDENRDWIISKFGKDGEWLVQLSDKANSIAGIYGIGRLASGVGYTLVKEMRAASRAVRAQPKALTEAEAKIMQRLDKETDAMLKQLDEDAAKAAGAAKEIKEFDTAAMKYIEEHPPKVVINKDKPGQRRAPVGEGHEIVEKTLPSGIIICELHSNGGRRVPCQKGMGTLKVEPQKPEVLPSAPHRETVEEFQKRGGKIEYPEIPKGKQPKPGVTAEPKSEPRLPEGFEDMPEPSIKARVSLEEDHHIATRYRKENEAIFKQAGLSIDDDLNLIKDFPEHGQLRGWYKWEDRSYRFVMKGHHKEYHEWVTRTLKQAIPPGLGPDKALSRITKVIQRLETVIRQHPEVLSHGPKILPRGLQRLTFDWK